ncbi:hypothetical protein HK099_008479 [Clydaea vesicula]|uniref:Uncharacterized protein n=1 Tax=Clydaea vesicula TaxID=447962 RepID=A0AAD5TVS9_9FUNG|nr:hypothetical protein HK099_008479 [Clydaea vesicula]
MDVIKTKTDHVVSPPSSMEEDAPLPQQVQSTSGSGVCDGWNKSKNAPCTFHVKYNGKCGHLKK